MNDTLIQDDLYAQEKGYKFQVCRKEAKGKPWLTCYDNIDRLTTAYELANGIDDAFETAIFLMRETGGTMYWKSTFPVLNSTCIYQEIF